MPKYKFCKIIVIAGVLLLAGSMVSSAIDIDDDFGSARTVQGEYFTVYYEPNLDIRGLIQQLDIYPSDEILTGRSIGRGDYSENTLTDKIDMLFRRICDILDMRLYSFDGNIKVCRDQDQVNRVYNKLFRKDLATFHSFYVYDINTIYISAENFRREVLGHEIAHAVISHYFVVQPSMKVQEVLAGYIEYQLRKAPQ